MSKYFNSDRHKASILAARLASENTKTLCQFCNNELRTSGLKQHEKSCFDNPENLNHCKNCDTRIDHRKAFCNRSCAATYNNVKFPKRERQFNFNHIKCSSDYSPTFHCLGCSKEYPLKRNAKGIVCSRACQQTYLWETVTKPSILRGERTKGVTIRRFVTERDGPQCSDCGITEWKGKPITMDLDHIDGDHTNNDPGNFRLLCPNCHRQTPTWGKKNEKRYGKSSLRYTPV